MLLQAASAWKGGKSHRRFDESHADPGSGVLLREKVHIIPEIEAVLQTEG
jgi:hypothetical protein